MELIDALENLIKILKKDTSNKGTNTNDIVQDKNYNSDDSYVNVDINKSNDKPTTVKSKKKVLLNKKYLTYPKRNVLPGKTLRDTSHPKEFDHANRQQIPQAEQI